MGNQIDPDKTYEVATLDYLAEGNDKMVAFLKGQKKICQMKTMRDIFLEYVKQQTAAGNGDNSSIEGRIVVK